jgi:hypothetical protein
VPYTPKYISVAKAGSLLQIDVSPSNVEEDVLDIIEMAEYAVESYVGADFGPSSSGVSKLFNGLGHDQLTLNPVLAVLDSVELLDTDGEVLDEITDVVALPNNPRRGFYRQLLRRHGNPFPAGLANIKITGTWGMPTIPPDFKLGVGLVVQSIFNARMVNNFTRFEMNGERQVYQVSPKEMTLIPPHAQQILDRYAVINLEFSE